MSRLRWFFLNLFIATALFTGVSLIPARADVPAFLEARHTISTPTAASKICDTYRWACQPTSVESRITNQDMKLVRRINGRINRRVRQIEDIQQYFKSEVWALPTARGGDCEDFALLKKRELIKAGIAADRLLIAVVLDRQMRGHAVLVVRSDRGDLVLDNMTSKIKSWDKTGYTFLKMQNPDRPDTWDAILAGGALLRSARG